MARPFLRHYLFLNIHVIVITVLQTRPVVSLDLWRLFSRNADAGATAKTDNNVQTIDNDFRHLSKNYQGPTLPPSWRLPDISDENKDERLESSDESEVVELRNIKKRQLGHNLKFRSKHKRHRGHKGNNLELRSKRRHQNKPEAALASINNFATPGDKKHHPETATKRNEEQAMSEALRQNVKETARKQDNQVHKDALKFQSQEMWDRQDELVGYNKWNFTVQNNGSKCLNGCSQALGQLFRKGNHFVVQKDGNAVVYPGKGGRMWATNTMPYPDGLPEVWGCNYFCLTVRDSMAIVALKARDKRTGNHSVVHWFKSFRLNRNASNSASLNLTTEADLVLVDGLDNKVWATGSGGELLFPMPTEPPSPTSMTSIDDPHHTCLDACNQKKPYMASQTGAAYFILQKDGNAVVYYSPMTIWSTNTSTGFEYCILNRTLQFCIQNDGNIVVLVNGVVYWATNVVGKGTPPYTLTLNNDATLTEIDNDGKLIWASYNDTTSSRHNWPSSEGESENQNLDKLDRRNLDKLDRRNLDKLQKHSANKSHVVKQSLVKPKSEHS